MKHEEDEIRLFGQVKKKALIICGLIVLTEIVFPFLYVNAYFKYLSADGLVLWAGFFTTTTLRYLLAPFAVILRVFRYSPLLILLVLYICVARERDVNGSGPRRSRQCI